MEIAADHRAGPAAQRPQVDPPLEDLPEHPGKRLRCSRRLQAVDPVDHPLANAADLGHDRHTPVRRRLQRGAPERLTRPGWKGKDVVLAVEPHQLRLGPHPPEGHAIAQAELLDHHLKRAVLVLSKEIDLEVMISLVLEKTGRLDDQIDSLVPADLPR